MSSINLSALSEESVETMEPTVSGSAESWTGWVSCHLPFTRRRSWTSPVSFLIRISWNWSSGMERSLVVVSVDVLLAAACFLFDHQMRPPRTAKTATATNSPFGFMGYLLFHQVAMPNPTTASGKITMLSQNTMFIFCALILSGRSSGALGRMEMRSSSAVSQLIMLRNRSRLPLNRMKLLPAHMELPTTTNRPGVGPL